MAGQDNQGCAGGGLGGRGAVDRQPDHTAVDQKIFRSATTGLLRSVEGTSPDIASFQVTGSIVEDLSASPEVPSDCEHRFLRQPDEGRGGSLAQQGSRLQQGRCAAFGDRKGVTRSLSASGMGYTSTAWSGPGNIGVADSEVYRSQGTICFCNPRQDACRCGAIRHVRWR